MSKDRGLSTWMIVQIVNIKEERVGQILHGEFNRKKVAAKKISSNFSWEQKDNKNDNYNALKTPTAPGVGKAK